MDRPIDRKNEDARNQWAKFMFFRQGVLKYIGAAIALCSIATAPVAMAQNKPSSVIIATANPGAPWSVIGASISNILQQDGVHSNVQPGGALANLVMVSTGRAQLGFTSAAVAPLAKAGQKPFPKKIDNVRVIAALTTNVMQVLVSKASDVNTIKDLKNKKFASQPVGNVSQYAFQLVLAANGLKDGDLDIVRGGQQFGARALKGRNAAGFTATSILPSSAFLDASRSVPSKFVPIDDATAKYVIGKNNGFFRAEIPANTYPGQTKAVPSIATRGLLVANADMPDDQAYYLTKLLVTHLKALQESHHAMKRVTVKIMAHPPGLALHPGARRYYKEIGVLN